MVLLHVLNDIMMVLLMSMVVFSAIFLPVFIIILAVLYYITQDVWLAVLTSLTFTTLICPIISTTFIVIKTKGKINDINLALSFLANNSVIYLFVIKVLRRIFS